MHLMRRLMIPSMTFNIHFSAEHVQGITNVAADLLSRFPHMRKEQIPVPPSLVKIYVKPLIY